MRSAFIYIAIISFVLGIAWQDFFELNTTFTIFLLALGFSVTIISLISAKKAKQGFAFLAVNILIIGIFAFALGTVRMQLAQQDANVVAHALDSHIGEVIEFEGVIIDEPDKREYNTNLVIQPLSITKAKKLQNIERLDLLILVKADIYQEFAYGDKVNVKGVLKKPENFTGDTGKTFDYISYLAKDDVHYIIKYPKIEIISHGNGGEIKAWLFGVKQRYIDVLGELIPEPQAGLAAGITVGAKRALGSELTDAFRNTGLIHIVVLSGFNVTIIIIFLLKIFAPLPRWTKYTLATLAVILFAILTGADAPVVRASAMGLLGVAAITLGRSYAITRALVIVAFAMIVWNPNILLHDIAFQLSVVATFGLIFFAPRIIRYLEVRLPSWLGWFAQIAGVTVAAQLAVLPLLIFYMGEVSMVAIIVNVLTLPLIPPAMLTTFLVGSIGMLSTVFAMPFAYATYMLLAYIIWIVEVFNALPFTTFVF